MGDKFEMVTAFSRDGPKKVYVQHLLKARGKEINELLEKKAYFYVCGDAANMAREVNAVLAQILAEHRGISEAKAEEIVKNMRAANQYQVSHRQKKKPINPGRPCLSEPVDFLSGTPLSQKQQTLLTHLAGGRMVVSGQRLVVLEKRTTITRACMRHGIKESVLGPSCIFVRYGSRECFFSSRLLEIFSSTFSLAVTLNKSAA